MPAQTSVTTGAVQFIEISSRSIPGGPDFGAADQSITLPIIDDTRQVVFQAWRETELMEMAVHIINDNFAVRGRQSLLDLHMSAHMAGAHDDTLFAKAWPELTADWPGIARR
jgi:hypothetical protein